MFFVIKPIGQHLYFQIFHLFRLLNFHLRLLDHDNYLWGKILAKFWLFFLFKFKFRSEGGKTHTQGAGPILIGRAKTPKNTYTRRRIAVEIKPSGHLQIIRQIFINLGL